MNKIRYFIIALGALTALSCGEKGPDMPWGNDLGNTGGGGGSTPGTEVTEVRKGEPLPAWQEGCLDIHFINSANGECNFFILPDGTTLLVDAGEMPDKAGCVPRKPNSSIRPYKVYSYYIKHFLPAGKSHIDWCAPSHFHIDHIGTPKCSEANHPEGGFAQSGLTALYNDIPYANLLDLGYPNYEEDKTIPAMDGEMVTSANRDWQKFVNWAVEKKGMKAARFKAGEEQIVLLNDKAKYSNVKVFNFIANTYAWYKENGAGKLTHTGAGRDDLEGNPTSAGIHIKYGRFDYMGAGDLEKAPQNSLAYYYRDYVFGGLDVFKANHHFNINSWGSQMQKLLTPRVILAHTLYDHVPDPDIISNIMDNKYESTSTWKKKDIFVTNATNVNVMGKLAGYNGHIVVRVAPGGESYSVYMLDDTDTNYKVKSIHGPFECQ